MRRRRTLLLGLGVGLLLAGIFLPTGWYDRLPRTEERVPEPWVRGVTLLRVSLALQGLALVTLASWKRSLAASAAAVRAPGIAPVAEPDDVGRPWLLLAFAMLLGAALRLYGLGSDLWLDEITTVLDYRSVSPFHIVTAYTSSNNHLLNTLLVKAMFALHGPSEAWIRLPAALLGIAGIPALYVLARLGLSRRNAALTALLLSVSYHHIFFSQNARGYTGLLLWSCLGTAFFLRALTEGRSRDWALYVATMFLALATVFYAAFVLAGHGVALLLALALADRKRRLPLGRQALAAWCVLGALSLDLYASAIPQAMSYVGTVYASPAVGYAPFSLEHLQELRRGVAAGFGGLLPAVAALALAGLGALRLLRQRPLFAVSLLAPLGATGLFLLARGLRFSPRFFLWGIPVAFILAVGAADSFGRSAGRSLPPPLRRLAVRGVPLLVVAGLAAASLVSLPAYYRVPKQPTRRSLEWLLARKGPDDVVVAAYLAKWGLRFYGPAHGLEEGRSFLVVHEPEELQRIEAASAGHRLWLLTTFPRALRYDHPALDEYLRGRYAVVETFEATIGDAEVGVWRREDPAGSSVAAE